MPHAAIAYPLPCWIASPSLQRPCITHTHAHTYTHVQNRHVHKCLTQPLHTPSPAGLPPHPFSATVLHTHTYTHVFKIGTCTSASRSHRIPPPLLDCLPIPSVPLYHTQTHTYTHTHTHVLKYARAQVFHAAGMCPPLLDCLPVPPVPVPAHRAAPPPWAGRAFLLQAWQCHK